MWIAYAEQSWPKAVDVFSAVLRLTYQFRDLTQYAENERNRNFIDDEVLEERYRNGELVCLEYLAERICVECLENRLVTLELGEFVHEFKRFVSTNEDGSI